MAQIEGQRQTSLANALAQAALQGRGQNLAFESSLFGQQAGLLGQQATLAGQIRPDQPGLLQGLLPGIGQALPFLFGGGGGGASDNKNNIGGLGGGGTGAKFPGETGKTIGINGTGGGGGGSVVTGNSGANGGSGIIIIRVLTSDLVEVPTINLDSPTNNTNFTLTNNVTHKLL